MQATQLNVQDPSIGMVADGVTDNYAAYTTLVNLVNAGGIGEVVFPPGVYLIDRFFNNNPNASLRPAGSTATDLPEFAGIDGLRISGYGATLKVAGGYNRGWDTTSSSGNTATGGAMTAGSTTLTITGGGTFGTDEPTRPILVYGAGPGGTELKAYVVTYVSPTEVVLDRPAATTVTGANVWIRPFPKSYSKGLQPLRFAASCRRFSVEGLELDGSLDTVTLDVAVAEPFHYGVFVSGGARDFALRDVYSHHWGADGFMLGHSSGATGMCENATLVGCVSRYNGRQGLSVVFMDGLTCLSCRFCDTGKNLGTYAAVHAPGAGVDVEPDASPNGYGARNLLFDRCEITGNTRSIFLAAYPTEERSITIRRSRLAHGGNTATWIHQIIFSPEDGVIEDCDIDVGAGNCQLGHGARTGSLARVTFERNTVRGSGYGLFVPFGSPNVDRVLVRNNKLIGTHTAAMTGFFPRVDSLVCDFVDNDVFIPAAAYGGSGAGQNGARIQARYSHRNRFRTDLPPATGHFATNYNAATVVADDQYLSGTAIRPGLNSAHDNAYPFSTGVENVSRLLFGVIPPQTAYWNPGPTAAGTQQSTDATITGAAVGDHVLVTYTAGSLSGTRVWGEVVAANTVRIFHRNDTAASVDLAGNFRVVVIKQA